REEAHRGQRASLRDGVFERRRVYVPAVGRTAGGSRGGGAYSWIAAGTVRVQAGAEACFHHRGQKRRFRKVQQSAGDDREGPRDKWGDGERGVGRRGLYPV